MAADSPARSSPRRPGSTGVPGGIHQRFARQPPRTSKAPWFREGYAVTCPQTPPFRCCLASAGMTSREPLTAPVCMKVWNVQNANLSARGPTNRRRRDYCGRRGRRVSDCGGPVAQAIARLSGVLTRGLLAGAVARSFQELCRQGRMGYRRSGSRCQLSKGI